MTNINWNAPARLLEREDGGSDLYVDFRERGAGSVCLLVAQVLELPANQRARMVIDAGAQGMFNMTDIMALSERADYPGS